MSAPARAWPSAALDPVARLRALAAALPHAAYEERTIAAPFERVWGIMGDLEHGVPRFEGNVRAIEITGREGEHLELIASGALGPPTRFDAILRPGWCVMRSRAGQIGMAATPAGEGRTRVAHFEASRVLPALARPLLARFVHRDLRRLAALCERRG